jgi:hypothetical protein
MDVILFPFKFVWIAFRLFLGVGLLALAVVFALAFLSWGYDVAVGADVAAQGAKATVHSW